MNTEFLLEYYKELNPGSGGLLEKLTTKQPVDKFPVCCVPRRFITAFTRPAKPGNLV